MRGFDYDVPSGVKRQEALQRALVADVLCHRSAPKSIVGRNARRSDSKPPSR